MERCCLKDMSRRRDASSLAWSMTQERKNAASHSILMVIPAPKTNNTAVLLPRFKKRVVGPNSCSLRWNNNCKNDSVVMDTEQPFFGANGIEYNNIIAHFVSLYISLVMKTQEHFWYTPFLLYVEWERRKHCYTFFFAWWSHFSPFAKRHESWENPTTALCFIFTQQACGSKLQMHVVPIRDTESVKPNKNCVVCALRAENGVSHRNSLFFQWHTILHCADGNESLSPWLDITAYFAVHNKAP